MEDKLATVMVKPGEADRILAGHPWVYSGSILRMSGEPKDGGVVQVKDHRQRFLGVGFFNSKSKIHHPEGGCLRQMFPPQGQRRADFPFQVRSVDFHAFAIQQAHMNL